MTPQKFIALWKDNKLNERAGAQLHFSHLCHLLGVGEPLDPENYCFERGKQTGQGGKESWWADVWKRKCFAWENKAPGVDLDKALEQVVRYADKLDNPPLLVVCDREMIRIKTRFNGHPSITHQIAIEEIGRPENLEKLRNLFSEEGVETFRPKATTLDVTQAVARDIGSIATALIQRGHAKPAVSHFLIRIVFCLFAEDCGLLPARLFARIIGNSQGDPARFGGFLKDLFRAMKKGGTFGVDDIKWFNGGLFSDSAPPLPLLPAEIAVLEKAAAENWNAIEPSIFGTLFENGLENRAERGAHFTDLATIDKIIQPVIIAPLRAEWRTLKTLVEGPLSAAIAEWETAQKDAKKREKAILKAAQTGTDTAWKTEKETLRKHLEKTEKNLKAARKKALQAIQTMLKRLNGFRVLDPACGSGNFLYLALRALKDLELEVGREAEDWNCGFTRQTQTETSPANVMGIEIEPYAAELARVTVWIGEIQWLKDNGYPVRETPVLQNLEHIENRDALMNEDGSEAEWPQADAVVGNPPFLGDKKMLGELGEGYVSRLRKLYKGRVPGGADFVTYWFEKARAQIEAGQCKAAGLVATNSIRQKRNRVILDRILGTTRIFEVWGDEPWWDDKGAAVRVSLVCFGAGEDTHLDGKPVTSIHSNLTAIGDSGGLDLTQAGPLPANKKASFFGLCLAGPFKVDTPTALEWLQDTGNPNGQPNSQVLRPIYNGSDITRRWAGHWVVDFAGMNEEDAADYLKPFAHVEAEVKPIRLSNREAVRAEKWWWHGRRRPELRSAIHGLAHYIATPETAKHRFFVKLPVGVAPEHSLIVIPRQDDTTLGILSSRLHCVWALAKGGRMGMGNDPRYNSSLTFETFPFPEGFTLHSHATPEGKPFNAIAEATSELNTWREHWLNPKDWVDWEQTEAEKAAGFPPRPKPKKEHETAWKKRSLTALYNEYPASLRLRQEKLDKAVAEAYGWTDYAPQCSDEEILRRLLALNLERAKAAPESAPEDTALGGDAEEQSSDSTSDEPPPEPTKRAKKAKP